MFYPTYEALSLLFWAVLPILMEKLSAVLGNLSLLSTPYLARLNCNLKFHTQYFR